MAQARGYGGGGYYGGNVAPAEEQPRNSIYDEYNRRYRGQLNASVNNVPQSPLADRLEAEKAVDALATNMSPLDALNASRKSLVEQQYQSIIQKREQEAERARQDLARNLGDQRRAFRQGKQAVSEDSFSRGRNLFRSLASRGLAGSGLQQLGDVQNRMATGRAIGGLYGNLQQGLETGALAEQRLSQDLSTSLADAGTARTRDLLNIDEQTLNRQDAQKREDTQLALQIGEILANPDVPQDLKAFYSQQLGGLLTEDKQQEVEQAGLTSVGDINEGISDITFNVGNFAGGKKRFKDPRTNKTVTGTKSEVLDKVSKIYTSDPNFDERVSVVWGGATGGDIRFAVKLPDGTVFQAKTYKQALDKIR